MHGGRCSTGFSLLEQRDREVTVFLFKIRQEAFHIHLFETRTLEVGFQMERNRTVKMVLHDIPSCKMEGL